jgi:hypothetical protein
MGSLRSVQASRHLVRLSKALKAGVRAIVWRWVRLAAPHAVTILAGLDGGFGMK